MSTSTAKHAPSSVREQDLLLSGSRGHLANSARAGFLPISLLHIPVGALDGMSVYIRLRPGQALPGDAQETLPGGFCLYSAESARFTDAHRARLVEHGVRFIYIRMADQSRFGRQTQARLQDLAADPAVAISERSEIVYETSVEMMNELLADPAMFVKSPRLEQVSRSITTLVINDPVSFSHLFAISHHDFYTATHMVNVATWMVPLAHELGYRDPDVLNTICQAGLLHDIGKTSVPEELLNKPGKLNDDEWNQIRRHPQAGFEYLSGLGHVDPVVLSVTRDHHERLDGLGYPRGLKGDQIDAITRICAVVDSFDAMTAFRPFKTRTLSVTEALEVLERETPSKYDRQVMDAWMLLMVRAEEFRAVTVSDARETKADKGRRHPRAPFHCRARAHLLMKGPRGLMECPPVEIVAHNLSPSGLGFLSQVKMSPGEFYRIYLVAKGLSERTLEGQIVRCREHNDTWHEIGMEFAYADAEGGTPPARS